MRKTLIYLTIAISALWLFSCERTEIRTSDDEEPIEIPVMLEITTKSQNQLETKATEDELAGTCNVDKVMLLVYSGATGITDRRQLTFHSRQILNCTKEGNRWVARGSITGTANTAYSIFALGYNSDEESAFEIIPSAPIVGNTTYGDTKVVLKYTNIQGTLNRYRTPEFFAGSVKPKEAGEDIFTAERESQLTGTLYRAVGKCQFKLTDIPVNIKKISWLTEKIADYNILYRTNKDGGLISYYPMGIPADGELRHHISEIASAERSGEAVWQTTLATFLIPLNESLFYIDAMDENGHTTRYLVKCADHFYNSIWIYIMGYGVKSYRFSIPHNYQVSVSGTFEQLQNSGNVLIDLGDMYEFDGGLLS